MYFFNIHTQDKFSKTHLCYLQHDLQVCYVSVLGIDEFMDVALPLLLLRAQGVQAVQVCTPCRDTKKVCVTLARIWFKTPMQM